MNYTSITASFYTRSMMSKKQKCMAKQHIFIILETRFSSHPGLLITNKILQKMFKLVIENSLNCHCACTMKFKLLPLNSLSSRELSHFYFKCLNLHCSLTNKSKSILMKRFILCVRRKILTIGRYIIIRFFNSQILISNQA